MTCRAWLMAVAAALSVLPVSLARAQDRPRRNANESEALSTSLAGAQDARIKAEVLALSKRIDAHLAKRQKEAGVTPGPRAAEAVYFRRLNLDLVGKIPELTQVQDFLDDPDTDKRWKWVEQLLQQERFPRHFGAVYRALILGNQPSQQVQFQMPSFEAWLRDKFAKDTPLDQMVREILIPNQGAMGRGGFTPGGGIAGSPQAFFIATEGKPENLAAATSRTFLGVKLECAQCHAHPFAKWTREQFWEFAAFYSGQNGPFARPVQIGQPVRVAFRPGREIAIPNTKKVVKAKFLDGKEPKWEDASDSRKVLADWVTARTNPYFARAMADHVWTYLMGVSLLEPILEPANDDVITHPELLNDLAASLVAHKFDLKFLVRAILHSEAYQRASTGGSKDAKDDYALFLRMPIRGMSAEQLFDSIAQATDFEQPVNANQRFFNPLQLNQTPRGQFLLKFGGQDLRHEPQTSILQALFLMNGKFLNERTRLDTSTALQTLARQKTPTAQKVRSLYWQVLSRPPRPEELQRLVRYIDRGGARNDQAEALADVYWALLNSSEFILNH